MEHVFPCQTREIPPVHTAYALCISNGSVRSKTPFPPQKQAGGPLDPPGKKKSTGDRCQERLEMVTIPTFDPDPTPSLPWRPARRFLLPGVSPPNHHETCGRPPASCPLAPPALRACDASPHSPQLALIAPRPRAQRGDEPSCNPEWKHGPWGVRFCSSLIESGSGRPASIKPQWVPTSPSCSSGFRARARTRVHSA